MKTSINFFKYRKAVEKKAIHPFNKTQIYDFRLHQASKPQTLISAIH